MPTTYEPIATQTLGSAAANITFTSIPATYTDLNLVITAGGGQVYYLRLNSDSGSNYSRTILWGEGTTASSSRSTSQTEIRMNGVSPSTVGFYTADVFSYAGSTNKTILFTSSEDNNGSGYVYRNVGLWRNTAAVTSILFYPSAGNLAIGTTATLYGIKNA
jgi:hypothetical protein